MQEKKLLVGLIGESPNDTYALRNLLKKHYPQTDYVILLENLTGSRLDSKDLLTQAKLAYHQLPEKPRVIIYMRDLDNKAKAQSEVRLKIKEQQEFRYKIFERLKKSLLDQAGKQPLEVLFLLIQYEIEALILADIETANQIWHTEIDLKGQLPRDIRDPKDFIRKHEKGYPHYDEGSCPTLFQELRLPVIQERHSDFSDFIGVFHPHLSA